MRLKHRLADAALLLLGVAVLAGAFALLTGRVGGATEPVFVPPPAPAPPVRAVVLTDELGPVTGPDGASVSAAEQAAAELDLELTLVPAPGSGFTTAPPGLLTLAGVVEERLPEGDVDLVVLQAGRADLAAAPGTLGAAAAGAIDRVRARVPQRTRIVLVGPSGAGAPEGDLQRVRDVLREVATRKRVHFLDPVKSGWLATPTPTGALTAPDQRQLGQELAEALRGLGFEAR